MSVAFATIIHDAEGQLVEPIRAAAPALRRMFSDFAASLTEATDPRVANALTEALGARVARHPTGEAIIGLARRNAVALALEGDAERVLYSDMDHVLRWIDADPEEMQAVLSAEPEAQLLIIGRTTEAMAAVPRRLRDTETPVNRAYELLTGRAADLLFAVRRMDRTTARDIVAIAASTASPMTSSGRCWPSNSATELAMPRRMASSTAPSTSTAPRPTVTTTIRCNGSGASRWPATWRERCGPICDSQSRPKVALETARRLADVLAYARRRQCPSPAQSACSGTAATRRPGYRLSSSSPVTRRRSTRKATS